MNLEQLITALKAEGDKLTSYACIETNIECVDNLREIAEGKWYLDLELVSERNRPNFYCQGQECSWEDMYNLIGRSAMMHDYPYYFKDGIDIYPKINEEEDDYHIFS